MPNLPQTRRVSAFAVADTTGAGRTDGPLLSSPNHPPRPNTSAAASVAVASPGRTIARRRFSSRAASAVSQTARWPGLRGDGA